MTVIARRFISIPERSASGTWSAISELLAPEPGLPAELASVAGVASSLISREAMTSPIVVWGAGPRVRIYCLYNDDASRGMMRTRRAVVRSDRWRLAHVASPVPPKISPGSRTPSRQKASV